MGHDVVGIDFQGLAILAISSVNLSTTAQSVTQVIVGLGVVGLDFQGRPVLLDGFVNLPLASQSYAQVVVGAGIAGTLAIVSRQIDTSL